MLILVSLFADIYAVEHALDENILYRREVITVQATETSRSYQGSKPKQSRPQKVMSYTAPYASLPEREEKVLKTKGYDARERVMETSDFPNSCVTRLNMKWKRMHGGEEYCAHGSGIMVGPCHVLTCAHNLYDHTDGWAVEVLATPGLNDDNAPFGIIPAARLHVFEKWQQRDTADDMALVILSQPIGLQTGWAGLFSTTDDDLLNGKVTIAGYPNDKLSRSGKGNTMWTMDEKLVGLQSRYFQHTIDTYPGSSGSGISTTSISNQKFSIPYVLGVHTSSGPESCAYNLGTRISIEKFEQLIKWIKQSYEIVETRPSRLGSKTGDDYSDSLLGNAGIDVGQMEEEPGYWPPPFWKKVASGCGRLKSSLSAHKKYVIATAVLATTAIAGGVTYWQLTSHHDDEPSGCVPDQPAFWPIQHVADAAGTLFSNMTSNQDFFMGLSALVGAMSCDNSNVTTCVSPAIALQQMFNTSSQRLFDSVDYQTLQASINGQGSLVCDILPVQQPQGQGSFNCSYDASLSAAIFANLQVGLLCPGLERLISDPHARVRLFFYSNGGSNNVNTVFDFLQGNRTRAFKLQKNSRFFPNSDTTTTTSNMVTSATTSQAVQTTTLVPPPTTLQPTALPTGTPSHFWSELQPDGLTPGARYSHTMGVIGKNIYMFGGVNQNVGAQYIPITDNNLWVFNGSSWQIVEIGNNSSIFARARLGSGVIAQNVLIVGGFASNNYYENDVWEVGINSTTNYWYQLKQSGSINSPLSLSQTSCSIGTYLYLFGTSSDSGVGTLSNCPQNAIPSNDLWQFDANKQQWVNVTPDSSPPQRLGARMTAVDSKIYLLGGYTSSLVCLDDFWEYNGSTWTSIKANGVTPRSGHAMGALGSTIFVFGGICPAPCGSGGFQVFNDLWKFDILGAAWVQLLQNGQSLFPTPSARLYNAPLCNIGADLYLFGGSPNGGTPLGDLWKLSSTAASPSTSLSINPVPPPGSTTQVMPTSQSTTTTTSFQPTTTTGQPTTITIPANDCQLAQWTSNSNPDNISKMFYLWQELLANGAPSGRWGHVLNNINQSLYIFGGNIGDLNVYQFDNSAWTTMVPSNPPPPGNRVWFGSWSMGTTFYIFGGMQPGACYSISNHDLWAFNTVTEQWNNIIPNNAPGSTLGATQASATIGTDFYVFGGGTSSGACPAASTLYTTYTNCFSLCPTADFWKFNQSVWVNLTSSLSPSARFSTKMVAIDKSLYLFGGVESDGGYLNDLWKYYTESASWISVTPNTPSQTSPLKRQGHAMGTIGQDIFVFGGSDFAGTLLNDLWQFETTTLTWKQLMPNGQPGSPPARITNTALRNINNDLYLFGGEVEWDQPALGDLWKLHPMSMTLFNISMSLSVICANAPFNVSWRVNTAGGSDEHVAMINFNGTQNYTATYPNAFASMILTSPEVASDFWINLQVQDRLYPRATVNQTVQFKVQKH